MAIAIENVTFDLPHIKLAGIHFGDSGKPLILALHGWLDNALSFEPLATELPDFQLLAVEWPGHGLSAHRPGSTPLHWADYLLDLHALLAHLAEAGTPVDCLLGHSLGGIVASAYGALYPEKLSSLILIEALSPLFESESNIRNRLKASIAGHSVSPKSATVYPLLDAVVRARRQLTGLDTSFCRLIIARNMEPCEGGYRWRTDSRLRLDSPLRFSFEQVDQLMTQVEVPTLLLTGDRGFKQLHTAGPLIDKWYVDLCHRMLEGDHHLHMGNAAGVAAAIREFLSAS